MPFQATLGEERILLYGLPGSGKTRAALSIAERLHKTGSEARMWALDTEAGAWETMLKRGYPDLSNVTVYSTPTWELLSDALEEILVAVKPEDWVVCDLFSRTWDMVQDHYFVEVEEISRADAMLTRRKEARKREQEASVASGPQKSQLKKEAHKAGDPDPERWQTIKPLFQHFANSLIFRTPGAHKLLISETKEVQTKGEWADSQALIDTYEDLGLRPGGEKSSIHLPNTVLLMGFQRKTGQWVYTTVKDREREMRTREPIGSEAKRGTFANRYLVKVAGWVAK